MKKCRPRFVSLGLDCHRWWIITAVLRRGQTNHMGPSLVSSDRPMTVVNLQTTFCFVRGEVILGYRRGVKLWKSSIPSPLKWASGSMDVEHWDQPQGIEMPQRRDTENIPPGIAKPPSHPRLSLLLCDQSHRSRDPRRSRSHLHVDERKSFSRGDQTVDDKNSTCKSCHRKG